MKPSVVLLCFAVWIQGCSLLLQQLPSASDADRQDSDADADDTELPDDRDSGDADMHSDADVSDPDDADMHSGDADVSDSDVNDASVADGDDEVLPPASCAEILSRNPDSEDGGYTIVVNEVEISVYCDMASGGWTRVVRFEADGEHCPHEGEAHSSPNVCRLDVSGCDGQMASAMFAPPILEYHQVRGYIRAYQYFSTDAFDDPEVGIDGAYVDGLSITYGSGPRQHIWTLASGLMQRRTGNSCPCLEGNSAPDYVGSHYYCDSGNSGPEWEEIWYVDNPLWGGGEDASCGVIDDPAWFERDLGVTTNEPIEVRIMQDSCDENTGIFEMELYVR